MQRWPAVPTAPNSTARSARSRSASSVTRMPLLPPSSSMVRPRRSATTVPIERPIVVEPVAEISGKRRSAEHRRAHRVAVADGEREDRRRVVGLEHLLGDAWSPRRAQSGACSEGFQSVGSPHTAAIIAFHAQTATGKLKAVMTPTGAERVPLLVHPVQRALGVHREAVELTREADREVGDVDHLLHFAETLAADLADLERHQQAERPPCAGAAPRRAGARPRRGAGRATASRRRRPRRSPGRRARSRRWRLRGRRRSARRSPGSENGRPCRWVRTTRRRRRRGSPRRGRVG